MYVKQPYFTDDETGHGNAPPPGGRAAPQPPVIPPAGEPVEDVQK